MQAYSDPRRESDPHALPDVEVFHVVKGDPYWRLGDSEGNAYETGWYWWSCLPGCMPDGDPEGPFDSEAEALGDAQSGAEDDDEDDEPEPHHIMVCVDCMTVAVNGCCPADTSEERDVAIVDGWIALDSRTVDALRPGARVHWLPNFNGETGEGEETFSKQPCDCCGSPLFGARYRFTALVREEG